MAARARNVTRVRGGGIMETIRSVAERIVGRSESAAAGAGTGRRTRNWTAGSSGPNAISLGSLQTQRNRSRDLVRKVPWLRAAVESVAADLVGRGIRPIHQSGNEKFRAELAELWRDGVKEMDADGQDSFYGLQLLAARTTVVAGECFIRRRNRRLTDGLAVPLQIQVLPPEFVPLHGFGASPRPGNTINQGIEFDPVGRRVAYWFYKQHPFDLTAIGAMPDLIPVRVPADDVIHIYKRDEPGQIRGVPWLSSVIIRARDMLELEDAELVRHKTAAMFVAFVTRNADGDSPLPDDTDDYGDDGDDDIAPTSLEPGTVQVMEPGEEVAFSKPPDSGANLPAFLKHHLRAMASAVGATYEAMTGDYSDSNFSSSRMARNNIERRAAPFQDYLSHQMNQRVMGWFIDAAVMAGVLLAPGYIDRRRDYHRTEWLAPGWPYINPKDEVEADERRVKAGFASRTGIARARGYEAVDVDAEQAADNERADGKGLKHSSDGRHAVKETGGSVEAPPRTGQE